MSRPHRYNSSYNYNYHDPRSNASRSSPRHRAGNDHCHQRRSSLSPYDDTTSNQIRRYPAGHMPLSTREMNYYPPSSMYADVKPSYPRLQSDHSRRHSHAPQMSMVRRHTANDTSDSDSSDGEPPSHARLSRSKRHSTFPASAYYSSHNKQVQSYQQKYVHPAIPPLSPLVQSHSRRQQTISRDDASYEPPRYTYQPPQFDDQCHHQRPPLAQRSETWSHHAPSDGRSRSKPPSRHGSRSVPPSSELINARHQDSKQTSDGAWTKAKKVYQSKTATNTAEIAMFGLLALSKAL